MRITRFVLAGLIAGAGVGLSGCSEGYGYGGVGYASDYYGDSYYDDGYGYGYGPGFYGDYGYPGFGSYFGWYGDFYYPGTGIYVYDRYRRPYRWNDNQRRYWQGRRNGYHGQVGNRWDGFAGRQSYRRPSYTGQGYGGRYRPNGAPVQGQFRGYRNGAQPQPQTPSTAVRPQGQPQPFTGYRGHTVQSRGSYGGGGHVSHGGRHR